MNRPVAIPLVVPIAKAPITQADGLRRLFGGSLTRCVPVVGNPTVPFSGVLLERLCTAFADLRLHTLVVDAAESSPMPNELAQVDLSACVENLSPQVSYLAARGLAMRYINAHGSAAPLMPALLDAAPRANVIVLHIGAKDLVRVLGHRDVCPLLLADDHPASVTQAYASMKLLVHRGGMMAHTLLLSAGTHSPRTARIAEQLAFCADNFMGAVLRDWAAVDPHDSADLPPGPGLAQLARELLRANAPGAALQEPTDHHDRCIRLGIGHDDTTRFDKRQPRTRPGAIRMAF